MKDIAQALREAFISPNFLDNNWEPANIVDATGNGLLEIATQIKGLAAEIRGLADAIRGGK